MHAQQLSWTERSGWTPGNGSASADLVLYFGTRTALACGARFAELRAQYPAAHLLGCSTGGQIRNDDVIDEEIAAVALRFERTRLKLACAQACNATQSRAAGET